ncbi:MAG: hypothetical protein HKO91_10040 [Desulfobacterales bacterium]|nr:hypothetical protein [Desulfobacterales bacterium]
MPKIKMTDWPPYSGADQTRREGTIAAAKLMANAAQTAPKAGGVDGVECELVYGYEDQEEIARSIEALSKKNPKSKSWYRMFRTEAVMVREADCILFIGHNRVADSPLDLNCGYCGGQEKCGYVYNRKASKYGQIDLIEDNEDREGRLIDGPLCTFFVGDLGYAVGSATYMANKLLVDCRPLLSPSMVARELNICPDSGMVVALPVASLPKNPFVDICPDYHYLSRDKFIKQVRKNYSISRQVHWFDYRSWYPKESKKDAES